MSSNSTANGIDGRYFLVGSARSGTTLLQAMLAAHSDVHSFPETHYFCELPLKSRRYRWAKLLLRDAARRTFANVMRIIGRDDLKDASPRRSPLLKHHVAALQGVLDSETLGNGKRTWVEKTPHHIDFIPVISGSVTQARFIHIVRDGRDVIASQLDAAQKSPEHWGRRSIDEMIALWNSDIAISASYYAREGHLIVSYEDLIDDPASVLQDVCSFMSIAFEPAMLEYHREVSGVLGWRAGHEYMASVKEPVKDTRLVKFKSLFTPEQREYITRGLSHGGDARVATGLRSAAASDAEPAGVNA